jgi:hypothetical protein
LGQNESFNETKIGGNMNFKIDGASSNVVIQGKPLNILISVSHADQQAFKLAYGEYVKLCTSSDWEGDTNKIKVEFLKNNQLTGALEKSKIQPDEYKLKLNDKSTFNSFQINITSLDAFDKQFQDGKSELKVKFFVQNESKEEIFLVFDIKEEADPIHIEKFEANQVIIQKNKDSLTLEYSIHGDPEKVQILNEGKIIDAKHTNGTKTGKIGIDLSTFPENRNHYFTLQLIKGDQQVTKTISIIYVVSSITGTCSVSKYADTDSKPPAPLNICASQNPTCLFALFSLDTKFLIGFTHDINGNHWNYLEFEDNDAAMRYYVNSPMLHLKGKNDSLGQLVFIGGSKIEHNNHDKKFKKYARQVGIINLDERSFTTKDMTMKDTDDSMIILDPVWGHNCISSAKYDHNKIYRLGGVNNFGKHYDTVYTSTDGIIWKKASFEIDSNNLKRVAPSAVFYEGKCLVAGGFENFGDVSIIKSDFEDAKDGNINIGYKWKEMMFFLDGTNILIESDSEKNIIKEDFGSDNKLKALTLAKYSESTDNDTGLVLIGLTKNDGILTKKLIEDRGYHSLSTTNKFLNITINSVKQTGTIQTAFVNGCLFFHIVYDNGKDGSEYSNYIYYYIPVINATTINFFKNINK